MTSKIIWLLTEYIYKRRETTRGCGRTRAFWRVRSWRGFGRGARVRGSRRGVCGPCRQTEETARPGRATVYARERGNQNTFQILNALKIYAVWSIKKRVSWGFSFGCWIIKSNDSNTRFLKDYYFSNFANINLLEIIIYLTISKLLQSRILQYYFFAYSCCNGWRRYAAAAACARLTTLRRRRGARSISARSTAPLVSTPARPLLLKAKLSYKISG